MEIRLPPEQKAHLAAIAASTGRSTDELVQEAIQLWEQEQARALAEFRKTLDDAEASIDRGEGIDITPESMRRLSKDVMERCRAPRGRAKSGPLMAYRLAKRAEADLDEAADYIAAESGSLDPATRAIEALAARFLFLAE